MIRDRDRKRIEAIIAKYNDSFSARIERLTDEQRTTYARYRERCEQWQTRIKAECPDDYEGGCDAYLYARSSEVNSYEPKLRRDVETALHGEPPRITCTMNGDEAANAYRDYVETGR